MTSRNRPISTTTSTSSVSITWEITHWNTSEVNGRWCQIESIKFHQFMQSSFLGKILDSSSAKMLSCNWVSRMQAWMKSSSIECRDNEVFCSHRTIVTLLSNGSKSILQLNLQEADLLHPKLWHCRPVHFLTSRMPSNHILENSECPPSLSEELSQ